MNRNLSRLSDREREVLTLLARSHDAKSIARSLGISVHTVNERLRAARQKLDVSSSREAARILLESQTSTPETQVYETIGVGEDDQGALNIKQPQIGGLVLVSGVCLMIMLAIFALAVSQANRSAAEAQIIGPKVVATSPAEGSVIPPGPFELSVTFDQPMAERSYSFVQIRSATFPTCAPEVRQSADRRTFTMRCDALAGSRYEIWFNSPPYMNFHAQSGASAQPQQLLFSTRSR